MENRHLANLAEVQGAGAWLTRWEEVRDAAEYVYSRRAHLIEGAGWRVARGPGTDLTITLKGVDAPGVTHDGR